MAGKFWTRDPYILIDGSYNDLTQIVIALKKEKYFYKSWHKAVEALCKLFYSLHSWPLATENLFYFFDKIFYNLETDKKGISSKITFIADAQLLSI